MHVMSTTGKNCRCGRPIDSCSDPAEDKYCSHYCNRFFTEGWEKIPMSDSKHHNGMKKYPPIPHDCDLCGKTFDIKYTGASRKNRSRFCSKDCWLELIGSGRGAQKRWIVLRILSQRGPMTSQEVGRIMDRYTSKGNARVVSSIIKPWLAKGWMSKYDDIIFLDFDGPIGQMIHPRYVAKYK